MLHFQSIQDDTAAKWLQVYPRYADLCIPNEYYSINLNVRYFMDILPSISSCVNIRGAKCIYCSRHRKENNEVDRTGHHFINGCSKDCDDFLQTSKPGAHFHATHNHVRHVLYNCCKHSLSPCREEPKDIFIGVDASRKRPDVITSLSVKSVPYVDYAIDVTIVSPFIGVQSGKLQNPAGANVIEPDKRANAACKKKNDTYLELCNAKKVKFVPFVMYTTGKLHSGAVKFLELVAEQAADRRHVPPGIIKNYYMKLLSVCLVKRIGFIISTKVNGWQSNNHDLVEVYRFGNERVIEVGDPKFDN